MDEPVVRLRNVAKTYHAGSINVAAVKGVTLEIAPDRFTMVVGPSGSGKTTLLNLIGCIDAPTRGTVEVGGEDDRRARRQRALRFPRAQHRLHLPELQSRARALGLRECRISAAAGRHRRRPSASSATLACSTAVGLAAAGAPAPERAERRSEAARRHRPRPRQTARRSCSPTSRPPISTPRPAPPIIALMRRIQARVADDLHLLDARSAADVACRRDLHDPRRRPRRAMKGEAGMMMLFKIAFRNILRNRAPLGHDRARRSPSARVAMLLFGGFAGAHLHPASKRRTSSASAISPSSARAISSSARATRPATASTDYRRRDAAHRQRSGAGPMIDVAHADAIARRHRRQFQRRQRRREDVPRHRLIPSDRDRMRNGTNMAPAAPYVPDTGLADDDDDARPDRRRARAHPGALRRS